MTGFGERVEMDITNRLAAVMTQVGLAQRTDQLGALAVNAAQVLLHGGFETTDDGSPFDVVAHEPMYRLRRYFPDTDGTGLPVVVLVPPMMFVADVYDVASSSSAVSVLHDHGVDPWVIDFGAPECEVGGLQRTLADHIVAISEVVDRVRQMTGKDVHLGGYSQGGVFSYAVAAYRRGAGIASVITFGSPVDTRSVPIFSLPEAIMEFAADQAAALLDRTGLPGWATREAFKLLDPIKTVRSRVQFLRQLHDREALLPNERQRRFVESEGWIAWPAPALAEALRQFIAQNRMLSGGLVIDGHTLSLADIDRPVLCFVGEHDKIGQPQSVRAIGRAAPRADIYEVSQPVGHLGLVVGSAATAGTWPTVAAWARHLDSGTELPAAARSMVIDSSKAKSDKGNPVIAAMGQGFDIGRRFGTATLDATLALTSGAATTMPRLLRLELVRPDTRVSLGRLLDERAAGHPEKIGFLWEDRAYTHAALKTRIDDVVAGLLSVGVRHGEPIGILMDTRPSMLIAVAALNRIGAVVVLLRPGGSLAQEIALGGVERIVTDPEHVAAVHAKSDVELFVLGGGGAQRDLGFPGVVDLERIDPEAVMPPAWYRPNPGRAREPAFVLFTGDGATTKTRPITNSRWARAAFGTAASADLGPRDTVYSVNPIHQPSGLLMSLGGAVASGARFAMASRFDPDTFWDEARRYGVTVVSYTWTSLRDVVEAPTHPGEHHHTIRTFIGSGMPAGLWHRVTERFAPARVVEYYASSQTDAILVNMPGTKVGCKGTPLPGSPELRIARIDESTRQLALRADGSAQKCRPREIGMLLSRVETGMSQTARPQRGLFSPGDAWLVTGDLFFRDEDGDYWLAGSADSNVSTPQGIVGGSAVEDALGLLDAIDVSVTYAVPARDDDGDLAVTAVTLRTGRLLHAADLSVALGQLSPDRRPQVVHVVEHIPTSTSHRPLADYFVEDGRPTPGAGVYELDPLTGDYQEATRYAQGCGR
jgi:putative long chain acyl-CoA synthase